MKCRGIAHIGGYLAILRVVRKLAFHATSGLTFPAPRPSRLSWNQTQRVAKGMHPDTPTLGPRHFAPPFILLRAPAWPVFPAVCWVGTRRNQSLVFRPIVCTHELVLGVRHGFGTLNNAWCSSIRQSQVRK